MGDRNEVELGVRSGDDDHVARDKRPVSVQGGNSRKSICLEERWAAKAMDSALENAATLPPTQQSITT